MVFSCGWVHAVVVWIDFNLSKDVKISTGLISPPKDNTALEWDPHTKQAVHLLRTPIKVDTTKEGAKWRLKYKAVFRPSFGDFEFDFDVINTGNVKDGGGKKGV